MAKTTCDIQFHDNPSKIYYGGQLLRGSTVLTLHKSKTLRGIYVLIEGKAHTEWQSGSGRSRTNHTGDQLYFSTKTALVGGEEGTIEVQPGIYTYTFQCNLPDNLPTSFEGQHGHIRYSVIVKLDRPLWPDTEFLEPFMVIKIFNLNDNPALRNPVTNSNSTTFNKFLCIFCWRTDPLTVTGNMAKMGYTPGEEIYFRTTIYNRSLDIQRFYLRLVKMISYFTHKNSSRTIVEETVLTEKVLGGVACNQVQTIDSLIKVPPIPATDITFSDICKVFYILRICCKADIWCSEETILDMPVMIGSYPLTLSGVITPQPLQTPVAINHHQQISSTPSTINTSLTPLLFKNPPTYYADTNDEKPTERHGNAFKYGVL